MLALLKYETGSHKLFTMASSFYSSWAGLILWTRTKIHLNIVLAQNLYQDIQDKAQGVVGLFEFRA